MEMSAAVFRKVHEPLTIEQVDIDKPWGREVLVRTVATGVCHSDLHVVDGNGRFPLDRPFVLGHEGAGVVEAVGADVTTLRVGDHVVACLSGFCGTCAQCLSGHPNVCTGGIVARAEAATPRLSQNGQPFRTFAAIGSYAEHMLLHENSLVRIDRRSRWIAPRWWAAACSPAWARRCGVRDCRPDRRSRCSAAAASDCPSCRARASAARGRSSRSTCSTRSWRWRRASARRTR